MRYAVEDPRHHKIYLTDADMAKRLQSYQRLAIAGGNSAAQLPQDDMRAAFGYVQNLRALGQRDTHKSKAFNPLFARFELIQLGQYAGLLRRVADVMAPLVLPAALTLLALVIWVGTLTGWRIIEASGAAFSLAGLATFAAVSPLLKIPHELGHALTARRAGVDLGAFGILIVGLFPLPFVDCSMADVQANRWQRIRISLAGVFVDLMVAGLAFLAWHFVDGKFLQTIFLNVFVFSSLNSLLFNGNPLVKLDGYYAFSDAIGYRNLATRASRVYKKRARFVTTFGRDGDWTRGGGASLMSLYALASTFYKLNILITVFWVMVSKFFGLGVLLTIWGAYAMFVSPVMNRAAPRKTVGVKPKASSRVFWGLVGVVLIILAFLPFPVVVTVPAQIDTQGTYAVTASEAGYVSDIAATEVRAGDGLIVATNALSAQERARLENELGVLNATYEASAASEPTRARMVAEQIEQVSNGLAGRVAQEAALTVVASADGAFIADPVVKQGAYVTPGMRLGYLLPHAGPAVLSAPFPERRIERLRDVTPVARGWMNGQVVPEVAGAALSLEPSLAIDSETGLRSYDLRVSIALDPSAMLGQTLWLRLNLGAQPGYLHMRDRLVDLRAAYRTAMMSKIE